MSTARSPQDRGPGGQYDNCGGTRVQISVPLDGHAYMPQLLALGDDELAAFVRRLDAALKEAHSGPADDELNEVVTVAVAARHLLRCRRARAAGDRAKAIVRDLISTTENE